MASMNTVRSPFLRAHWWTQARSEVKRSVIMDDFVYSVSERRVKVNGLANLSADLADIPLDK